jgi:nicotinamide riboside kinase
MKLSTGRTSKLVAFPGYYLLVQKNLFTNRFNWIPYLRIIITFESLQQVLKAEKLLRESDNFKCRTTPTPPGLSSDICSMSIELYDPKSQDNALAHLQKHGLVPSGVHCLSNKSSETTGSKRPTASVGATTKAGSANRAESTDSPGAENSPSSENSPSAENSPGSTKPEQTLLILADFQALDAKTRYILNFALGMAERVLLLLQESADKEFLEDLGTYSPRLQCALLKDEFGPLAFDKTDQDSGKPEQVTALEEIARKSREFLAISFSTNPENIGLFIGPAWLKRILPEATSILADDEGQLSAQALANRLKILGQSKNAQEIEAFASFALLSVPERRRLLKRVCIFGPESTGKTTMSKNLAKHFHTLYCPEYARTLMESRNNELFESDMIHFAKGMIASEEALVGFANRALFSDTDALTTCIWYQFLYKRVPVELRELAARQRHHLYLLLDVDVPWVYDPQRYLPNERQSFLDLCREYLENAGRPYKLVSGTFEERTELAIGAVEELLSS